MKMLLLEDMSTSKVKRALSTLAEIRSLLPQLVSDLTCGQKKKVAETGRSCSKSQI